MRIEPIKGRGVNRAKAVCDMCGRSEVATCDYTRSSGGDWAPNEGQVVNKITRQGWALIKGKLHCPSCEAKRKVSALKQKEAAMAEKKSNVAPIRRADPKQKRLIILALEDAYDDAEKRYKGGSTDKTVAEELGGGIMPGWVAEIREELFGPAGNEEADGLREDIAKLDRETKRLITIFSQEQQKKIDALRERLDGVVQAHDKRVKA